MVYRIVPNGVPDTVTVTLDQSKFKDIWFSCFLSFLLALLPPGE
jgi:hypothetical protein